MEPTTRRVLGKRPRQCTTTASSETDTIEPPKRSRPTRYSSDTNKHRSRNDLLTSQPSTLATPASSQSPPPLPNEHSKNVFPFMLLPAELRLHVYHMALVRPFPVPLHISRTPPPSDADPTPSTSERRAPRIFPPTDAPRTTDPVLPVLLSLNWQIYKEAKQLLYSENVFELSLISGEHTLKRLGQKTRSLIRHVVLTIPSHHDILDGFADLVRLGLRYCWGLKSFRIILQAGLPDDGRVGGATSVYANAFHILRWLPRGCSVTLEGCVSETVRRVVAEEGRLMNVLDETSYLKRQHQMPERH